MASLYTGSICIKGLLKGGWKKNHKGPKTWGTWWLGDFPQQTGHVLPEGHREGSGPSHRGGHRQDVPELHVTDGGLRAPAGSPVFASLRPGDTVPKQTLQNVNYTDTFSDSEAMRLLPLSERSFCALPQGCRILTLLNHHFLVAVFEFRERISHLVYAHLLFFKSI